MQFTRIAWRNLKRNKVRTLIAILAITTVVVIVVFARGLMVGITDSSFKMYIDYMYGHVRITQEEYQIREVLLSLDYTVFGFNEAGVEAMIGEIEELDKAEYVLPRIRFGAMASINDQLIRMIGVGIDPAREDQHGALKEDITAGRLPEMGNEILIGQGLLKKLGVETDDRITLVFSDAHQSLRGRTFEIVGVSEAGVAALDDRFFYLPIDTARDMLWLEDEATELFVFAAQTREADALKEEIDGLLTERGGHYYSTALWNKADPFVDFYYEVTKVMDLVYVLFIVMGAVVIISTLTMIVRERTSEIGMMAALGLRGRDIMKIFILEGTFMGIIGSFLGVIIGGIITFYYSKAGIHVEDFAMLSKDLELIIEPVFYLAFNLENLIVSFALGVVVVTLSCLYPAYKAAKLEPVDALHYIEE